MVRHVRLFLIDYIEHCSHFLLNIYEMNRENSLSENSNDDELSGKNNICSNSSTL